MSKYYTIQFTIIISCFLHVKSAYSQKGNHWNYDCGKITHLHDIDALRPVLKNGLYGYIDHAGRVVVPYKYEDADYYSVGGLAKVKLHGLYGLIDTNGQEVLPCKYDCIGDVSKGTFARINQHGKQGFINNRGVVIASCIYDEVGFSTGRCNDDVSFYNGCISVKKGGKWGFIDTNGRMIIDPKYDRVNEFYNDTITRAEKEEKAGLISIHGVELSPFKYVGTDLFGSTQLLIAMNDNTREIGLVNKDGDTICPIKYDLITSLDKGYCRLRKGRAFYLLNWHTGFILPTAYDYIEEIATVHDRDNTIWVEKDTSLPLFKAKAGGQYSIIDGSGNQVSSHFFDNVFGVWPGLIAVKVAGKWGIVDRKGNDVITPRYDYLTEYSNGFAIAVTNCKATLMDSVCACDAEDRDFGHGMTAYVERTGLYEYIDKKGRAIFSAECTDAMPFVHGVAWVKQQDKWRCIDTNGQFISQHVYEEVDIGNNDHYGEANFISLWLVKRNGLWGAVNTAGKEIMPCIFDEISYFNKGEGMASKNGRCFYVNDKGVVEYQ